MTVKARQQLLFLPNSAGSAQNAQDHQSPVELLLVLATIFSLRRPPGLPLFLSSFLSFMATRLQARAHVVSCSC